MRRWSREGVIRAFQEFGDTYGEGPRITDTTGARKLDWLPSSGTVNMLFGSWNKALIAAGFPPRSRGAGSHLVPPTSCVMRAVAKGYRNPGSHCEA